MVVPSTPREASLPEPGEVLLALRKFYFSYTSSAETLSLLFGYPRHGLFVQPCRAWAADGCRRRLLTDDGPPADDFQARGADELSFTKGDRIVLIERDGEYQDGWYYGKHQTMGTIGLFPEGRFNGLLLGHIPVPDRCKSC